MSTVSNNLWVWNNLKSQNDTIEKFQNFRRDINADRVNEYIQEMFFFYCGCEGKNDHGWGCAWRCFQMIASVVQTTGPLPSFDTLYRQYRLTESDAEWAEPGYVKRYLDAQGIPSQLVLYNRNVGTDRTPTKWCDKISTFTQLVGRLVVHFLKHEAPVMIDDTIYAMNIVGIRTTSTEIILFIADPHKTSPDDGLYTVAFNPEGQQIATTGIDDGNNGLMTVKEVHFKKGWIVLFPQKKKLSTKTREAMYEKPIQPPQKIVENKPVENTKTSSELVEINVRLRTGQTIIVNLTLKDTVETLKQKVQAQANPEREYGISYLSRQLLKNMTLEFYGIKKGSTVYLYPISRSVSEVVTIFVRTQDKRILNISISSDATLGTLREMIAEAENIPRDGLMLYYRRLLEEDNMTLASYSIDSETTVGIGRTWEETHSEPVLIHVEILGGRVLNINISLDETICTLKKEVMSSVGDVKMQVDREHPFVTFAGRQLSNHRTLESQGITTGATVIFT